MFAFRRGRGNYGQTRSSGKRFFAFTGKFSKQIPVPKMNPAQQLPTTTFSSEKWQEIARNHFEKVSAFTTPVRKRRDKGESHPVEDFLFNYYPYPIALIELWHPGLGIVLEIEDPELLPPHLQGKRYSTTEKHLLPRS